ncbi:MAG: hypothetical protein Q7T16_01425 [Candidatus Burarchaeum sp.]|nr:hypothetical protein [Candidatus Burarchaeum sp.]MDO8339297.1 hypothetical protein [Candidatus Burarchaeum sp.]
MSKTDTAEKALSEAREWLSTAELALSHCKTGAPASVACAEAIHAIIRANDALTIHFLNRKATRHDDMPFLFLDLLRQGKLEKTHEHFHSLLSRALHAKSGADYGRQMFTLQDADYFVKGAREFLDVVAGCIK